MTAKAQPGVPGSRDYIGNSDGPAAGKRAGTEEFVRQAVKWSNGALWNNGTYGQRDIKGKPGTLSVHATGRAMDLSYRKMDIKGIKEGRAVSKVFIDKVLANANAFGIQMVIDYYSKPWGASWRCDRQAWKVYETKTVSGAPGGDWWHVELSPAFADSPEAVKAIFEATFGVSTTA